MKPEAWQIKTICDLKSAQNIKRFSECDDIKSESVHITLYTVFCEICQRLSKICRKLRKISATSVNSFCKTGQESVQKSCSLLFITVYILSFF